MFERRVLPSVTLAWHSGKYKVNKPPPKVHPVILVGFIFILLAGEPYRRRLTSLLLGSWDAFRARINSLCLLSLRKCSGPRSVSDGDHSLASSTGVSTLF